MGAAMAKTKDIDANAGPDPRWAAVAARDRHADGTFYYSVKTTGVYCRPSCAARRPNPKNVSFHRTWPMQSVPDFGRAGAAGPISRRSSNSMRRMVADICRVIEAAVEMPSLAALAAAVGPQPVPFPSCIQGSERVTPRAYAAAHRDETSSATSSRRSKTVTEAIYDAGFNSGGRFYETSDQLLGMTPTSYRAGGAGTGSTSPLANARSGRSWWRRARRACAPSCSATIPTRWCAIFRIAFPWRRSSAATPRSRSSSPGSSVYRIARGSGSTCRWMSAGRRFSSVSGRPFARFRRARRRVMPRSPAHRRAERRARRGTGMRRQPAGRGNSLPSGH